MSNDSKPTAVPADDHEDTIDEILTEQPSAFVARVIAESQGLSISAKLRHSRSAAIEAQQRVTHAKASGDRYAAKQWAEVAWSLKTLRT